MKELLQKFGIDEDENLVAIHGELLKLQILYTEALKNASDDRKEELSHTLAELQQALATITILMDQVERSQQYEYSYEESEKAFLSAEFVDLFGIYEGMSRSEMEEQVSNCMKQCDDMAESESAEVCEKAALFERILQEVKGLIQVSKAFTDEAQLYHVLLAYLSLASIQGVDRNKLNMLFMGAFQGNLECIKTIGNLCFINKTYKESANCWLAYAAQGGLNDSYFLYGNALAADKKIEEAVVWYDRYLQSGNVVTVESKSALGMAYLMAKEYEKGYALVSFAAEKGCPNAMIGLGALYECGEVVEKNFEKALSLYETAEVLQKERNENTDVVVRAIERVRIAIAEEKSGFDWMNIPFRRLFGITDNMPVSRIMEKVSLVQHTYESISLLSDQDKAEKAKRIVHLGTEIKNIVVQQNLPPVEGGMYFCIETCMEIYDQLYNREGFQTILKQFHDALTGNPESVENTGFVCLFGFKNQEMATKWVEAACELGSSTARLKFAVALQKTNDHKNAFRWYQEVEKAGELNSAELKYHYGISAFRANEREVAAKYVRMAADENYRAALLTMGAFYEDGCGVTKNYEVAMEYYQKAKKTGLSDADKYITYLEKKMTAARMKELQNVIRQEENVTAGVKDAVSWNTQLAQNNQEKIEVQAVRQNEHRKEIIDSVKESYEESRKANKQEKKKFSMFRYLFHKKKKNEEETLETVPEI